MEQNGQRESHRHGGDKGLRADEKTPRVDDVQRALRPGGSEGTSAATWSTWTADTIMGSGFWLVISQLIDVSNIAMPTFDNELATRMTANATLPNRPQRESAPEAVTNLTPDSLDNRTPRKITNT